MSNEQEKRGRGRLKEIPQPEIMEEMFNAYRTETKSNPVLLQDFVGKDGDEVNRKRERPLTMEGFEIWCAANGFIHELRPYFENREGRYADFVQICTLIKKMIRQDQINGGMTGIYNTSITQRLNSLVERSSADDTKEVTIKVRYDRDRSTT